MNKPQPTVYIIAGPNGAGKTMFASDFLPGFVECLEFVNADLIAAGLSPFDPESQNIQAGRLMLTRIKELRNERTDFGFETTLSGRSYVRLLKEMKAEGYRIVLFFLWLPNVDLAISRVANRVQQGGHHIPEPVIRRRYQSGLCNLFHLYRPLCDVCWIYDSAMIPPVIISKEENNQLTQQQPALFSQIEQFIEGQCHD